MPNSATLPLRLYDSQHWKSRENDAQIALGSCYEYGVNSGGHNGLRPGPGGRACMGRHGKLGERASGGNEEHCVRQRSCSGQSERESESGAGGRRNASSCELAHGGSGHSGSASGRATGGVREAHAGCDPTARRRLDTRRPAKFVRDVPCAAGRWDERGDGGLSGGQGGTRAGAHRRRTLRHGVGEGERGEVQLRPDARGRLRGVGGRASCADGGLRTGLVQPAGMQRSAEGCGGAGFLWADESCGGDQPARQLGLCASVAWHGEAVGAVYGHGTGNFGAGCGSGGEWRRTGAADGQRRTRRCWRGRGRCRR